MPCGACRQWIADLAPNATIYIDGTERDFQVSDLLPFAFTL
jgi:cytidine deaminase